MKKLASHLIDLGYKHPELRPDLRKVLDKISVRASGKAPLDLAREVAHALQKGILKFGVRKYPDVRRDKVSVSWKSPEMYDFIENVNKGHSSAKRELQKFIDQKEKVLKKELASHKHLIKELRVEPMGKGSLKVEIFLKEEVPKTIKGLDLEKLEKDFRQVMKRLDGHPEIQVSKEGVSGSYRSHDLGDISDALYEDEYWAIEAVQNESEATTKFVEKSLASYSKFIKEIYVYHEDDEWFGVKVVLK